MKLKDWILLIAVLVVAFAAYLGIQIIGVRDAERISISVDGKIYGVYSLHANQEIQINDTNVLVIKDGFADMTEADCPDQICVDHKEVSKTGETIVCLPNKIVVEVEGADSSELDAVTN